MAKAYTVPNQKVLHVNKVKSNQFGQIDYAAAERAMHELTPTTFKLWFYLDRNKDDSDWALSRTAAINSTGMSERSYKSAVKELTEKGYLKLVQGNVWNFYEYP